LALSLPQPGRRSGAGQRPRTDSAPLLGLAIAVELTALTPPIAPHAFLASGWDDQCRCFRTPKKSWFGKRLSVFDRRRIDLLLLCATSSSPWRRAVGPERMRTLVGAQESPSRVAPPCPGGTSGPGKVSVAQGSKPVGPGLETPRSDRRRRLRSLPCSGGRTTRCTPPAPPSEKLHTLPASRSFLLLHHPFIRGAFVVDLLSPSAAGEGPSGQAPDRP